MILKDTSTWLEDMTKLGYQLHLLSSDFDRLHDQSPIPNASKPYLVLVIEFNPPNNGKKGDIGPLPLREKFLDELKTHDWAEGMRQHIKLKQSGILLNISMYYTESYAQSPFADFTILCEQEDTRLCAVTHGNARADVTRWFRVRDHFYVAYEIDGQENLWQFRSRG